jgi:hypothetical protein
MTKLPTYRSVNNVVEHRNLRTIQHADESDSHEFSIALVVGELLTERWLSHGWNQEGWDRRKERSTR